MKLQLNNKQLKARNKIDGPLLIIAGAGSGKTATLTARVEYMIREKGIDPKSIMMVTFTNKAAREMRERVAKTLGIEAPKNIYIKKKFPLIGTFHSIGIFILKEILNNYLEEELNIGIKKDFVIYDEQDKLTVLKQIMKNKLQIDEKEYPVRQIAFYISNAKNSLINASQYENEVDSTIKEVVHKAYIEYEKELTINNALDFDDILIKTLQALSIPKVLEKYHEIYKYLMIDEYQDTNRPQYEIVKLLAKNHGNLAVVGDDSQSIYSWRGADMKNIINFKKDYDDVLIVKLEQNYRSTKNILAGANAVIVNNKLGIKKELWTDNITGEKINFIDAPDDKTEASIIAKIIDKTDNLSENLILYRTNAQSRQLEEALMIKGIPYRVIGGLKFYDRKEIKDILAYLKIIYNQLDIISLKRIINVPTRKIGSRSIEILDEYRNNFNLSYIQIFENIDEVEELKPAAKNSLKNFYEIYKQLKNYSNTLVVSKLIKKIIDLTGYKEYITNGLSEDEKEQKLDNISELINVASEYNGMEAKESLEQFLEEVALITDMDTKEDRKEYVTLMTIHTAKGLEEKRVFLTGLEDGIFPSFRSVNDNYALEEERRLMYVAMTRAREELFISKAKERFHFGDYVRNPISRFIAEIPNEYIEDYDLSNFLPKNNNFFSSQNNFLNNNKESQITYKPIIKNTTNNDISQFKIGDRLTHPKFGTGILISLNGEIGEIAFEGKKIKKMNIKIAPVRKV